jgi:dodecin
MSDSAYKVVTLIGTSAESWEKAAKAAVEAASHSLRELRITEVVKQDMVVRMARWKPTGLRSGCRSNMRAMSKSHASHDLAIFRNHQISWCVSSIQQGGFGHGFLQT